MPDTHEAPQLAALRRLEESLRAHRKDVAALPPEREGVDGSSLRFRLRALLCGHGRAVRRACLSAALTFGVAILALGLVWMRLASGPISLDLATPWLASAIEEKLGSRYRVEVGGTVLERDEHGRVALRIRDIVLRDSEGTVVANAPRAEVGLSSLSLLTGAPRAESLNLVGADVSVRVEADGDVTVSAAVDKRPIATAPKLASAIPSAAPERDVAPRGNFDLIAAVLTWIDSLSSYGLDGRDLAEIGLKSGSLVVEDTRNGQRTKFTKINLSLTRPEPGEVVLRLSSDDQDRPWAVLAGVKPIGGGRRAVSVEARNVMVRDLLLALRLGDVQFDPDLPMSASLRAEIEKDGTPHIAAGRLLIGPGTVTDINDPVAKLHLDRFEANLEWDAAKRTFAAPLQIVAGANRMTLVAHAEAPRAADDPWILGLTGGSIMLGASDPGEEKILLDRVMVRGRWDQGKKKLDVDQVDIGGKDVAVAASGSVDFSTGDPHIAIGAASRRMTVAAFKQIWPVFINTPVRNWVKQHLQGGDMERIEIATNAPMSVFKAGGPPVPDEGLSVQIVTTRTTVMPVDTLPPIREADLVTKVSGRTVTVSLGRGVVELPSGRKLTVANGVFEVPDSQVKKPPARARMRIEGPVPAAAEFLALGRLREASGAPLDPATSRGAATAQVTLGLPLDPDMPPGSITYNVIADVANFAADKFVMSQRVEAPTLRIVGNPQGYQVRGDVRIGGVPANIDYRKPRGEGEAEVRLQATFDEAARKRFGINLGGSVSGSIPIKLGGKIASSSDQESRFAVEADLTQVKLDNPVPGWSKAAGRAARASFTMRSGSGRPTRIDDIAIDASGSSIRGAVELDNNNEIVSANFPVFALSDGDKASVKAERMPDGALKLTIRGDVFDGRNFVKATLGGTGKDTKSRGIADLDLDVKVGAVAGFHGEALRGLDLKLVRRGGQIKHLSLLARHGLDAPLSGDLRGRHGTRQAVYIESNDAGALLRFTDTYPRMHGGQMWIAMDPPTLDAAPKEGLLNVSDFSIRGEAALDRIVAGAPGAPRTGVEFSRMRVEFIRSPGKLTVKEAVVRGPTVGATMDGVIDYAANNVRARGTFVPLYGLNNIFGQIPIVGLFLGGGSNEGLVGITFEVVGPPGAPTMRVNPISAVAPGLLRKVFEFPSSVPGERYPDPRTSMADR